MQSSPAGKVREACDRCHFKKLRCERAGSMCGRCMQNGWPCVFSPRRPYDTSKRIRTLKNKTSDAVVDTPASVDLEMGQPTASDQNQAADWNATDFSYFQQSADVSPATTMPFQIPQRDWWANDRGMESLNHTPPTFDYMPTPSTQRTGSIVSSSASAASVREDSFLGDDSVSIATSSSSNLRLAEIAKRIFQTCESWRASPDAGGRNQGSSINGYPDQYAELFSASQSLMSALSGVVGKEHGKEATISGTIGDSEILMILSCYLKLLSGYDRIFDFWSHVLESTHLGHAPPSSMRDTLLNLLPPVSIGLFLAPTCYVSQVRLVLEVTGKLYQELSQSLERISMALVARDRIACAERISYVSDTTVELVMGKNRSVAVKKEVVSKLIEDKDIQKRLETHLSTMRSGSG